MCSLILVSKENHLVLEGISFVRAPKKLVSGSARVVRRVDVTAYLGDCGMAMSCTENWLQEVRALPSRCCAHLPTFSVGKAQVCFSAASFVLAAPSRIHLAVTYHGRS